MDDKQCAHFYTDNNGYERWNSEWSFTGDYVAVHRLLAIAKYGFDDVCGSHVHHKNGVKWDNRMENVEIMSESEHNRVHMLGEDNPQSKFDIDTVREIRGRYKNESVSQSDLADEYGVNQSTISRVVNGKRWGSEIADGN